MNIGYPKNENFSKFGELMTGDVFRTNLENNNDETLMKIEEINDGKTNNQGYGTFNAVKLKDGTVTFVEFDALCASIQANFTPDRNN